MTTTATYVPAPTNEVRVIGIDPSLSATGLALPDGSTQTILYSPRNLIGDVRLEIVYEALSALLLEHDVTHAVIEDLPAHAKSAGLTGKMQGIVRLALLQAKIPYVAVVPSSVKKFATGKGTADKSDLRMSLYQRCGIDEKDDNRVDAFWLRQMAMHKLGLPEVDLPKANLESLEKVAWSDSFDGSLWRAA